MRRICANCEELLARVIDEAESTSHSFSELYAGLRTTLSVWCRKVMLDIQIYIEHTCTCNLMCESFNATVRAQNGYSNRLAPSCDTSHHFVAVLQHIHHICDIGSTQEGICK